MDQARAAEDALQHAREEMQQADARTAAAEAAKIELSLRLAAALSEQEMPGDVSAVPSASARSVLSTHDRRSAFDWHAVCRTLTHSPLSTSLQFH